MNTGKRKGKPSIDLKGILIDMGEKSLMRYGYFALSQRCSYINVTPIPNDDPKCDAIFFDVDRGLMDKVKNALLKNGDREMRCDGDVIVSLNRLNLSETIKTPENIDELFAHFCGSGVKYRGQASASHNLNPSVYRNDNRRRESEFYYGCTSRMASDFININSTFDILVKMQHYGVPTRLLDVTDSAMVALYFAIENLNEPGVIYKFQPSHKQVSRYDSLETVLISLLAKCNKVIDCDYLEELAKKEYPSPWYDPENVEKIISSCYFVTPKQGNPRIINQKGAFILVGSDVKYDNKKDVYERSQKSSSLQLIEQKSTKIIISKKLKIQAKQRLSDLGFTHFDIYPDLGSIAKDIQEMDIDHVQNLRMLDRIKDKMQLNK